MALGALALIRLIGTLHGKDPPGYYVQAAMAAQAPRLYELESWTVNCGTQPANLPSQQHLHALTTSLRLRESLKRALQALVYPIEKF